MHEMDKECFMNVLLAHMSVHYVSTQCLHRSEVGIGSLEIGVLDIMWVLSHLFNPKERFLCGFKDQRLRRETQGKETKAIDLCFQELLSVLIFIKATDI